MEKSIGIGIEKKSVSEKVSDSVSKKIGIGKKFRIRFRSDFGFRHTLWNMNKVIGNELSSQRTESTVHCDSVVW